MKRTTAANPYMPLVQGVIRLLPFVGRNIRKRNLRGASDAVAEIEAAWRALSQEQQDCLRGRAPYWAVPAAREDARAFLLGILNANVPAP